MKLTRLISFLRAVLRGRSLEREMAEEMRFHLDSSANDLMRSGLSPSEAARQARLEFGTVDNYKEDCREALGLRPIDELRADVRYALRTLSKSPAFTTTAILTLALGIGANTGLFTMVNLLLLRPIPVQDPWSLYQITGNTSSHIRFTSFSYREYQDLAARNQAFRHLIADTAVRARTPTLRAGGYAVSGNYFATLGVGTMMGRPILPEDDSPGARPVIVLSHVAWQRIFHSDPQLIGKELELAGHTFSIAGVATPEFTGIDTLLPDFWTPLSAKALFERKSSSPLNDSEDRSLRIIGRIRPEISQGEARGSMSSLLAQATQSRAAEMRLVEALFESRATYQSWNHADIANVIPIVTAFTLILLIACTNLSNVLLARAQSRQRELGIRLSLGASRGRVVRQLITESALLSLAAGVVGLALSHWSWTLIRHVILSSFSMKPAMAIVEINPDYRVFAFTFLLSLATGIVFGLAPALHATRPSLNSALRAEGSLLGSLIRTSRFRDGLVIAQFSFSMVLLIGAGLLLHSSLKFAAIHPGFELTPVVSIQTIQDTGTDPLLQTHIAGRLKTLPGVLSVSHVQREPLRGALPKARISFGTGDSSPITASYNEVTPEYFETLGIPILRGRAFSGREGGSTAAVVVVSESTAKRFWPNQDPIGRTLRITLPRETSERPLQVVGIAKDIVSGWLWDGVDTTCIYLPAFASRMPYYSLLVHVNTRALPMIPTIRGAISVLDPNAEFDLRTLEEVRDLQLLPFRLTSWGAAALGALGLLLASIGIYGVMAYLISQRTREIGIRIALGAQQRHVLWMTLGEGSRLIGIAVAVGLILSLAQVRLLRAMIFNIDTSDPATFFIAPCVLALTGLLATYLPGRSATRVDPMVALRYD